MENIESSELFYRCLHRFFDSLGVGHVRLDDDRFSAEDADLIRRARDRHNCRSVFAR
jgi:hypothetical protein